MLATLDGRAKLPSTDEMLRSVREEMAASAASGKEARHYHVMSSAQWAYNDRLSQLAQCQPIPPVVVNIYEYCGKKRASHLTEYRSMKFKVVDDEHFMELLGRI